jgi:hypothetical protein
MKRGEVDFGLFETEQAMVAVNHLQGEDFMVVGEVRQEENQYGKYVLQLGAKMKKILFVSLKKIKIKHFCPSNKIQNEFKNIIILRQNTHYFDNNKVPNFIILY